MFSKQVTTSDAFMDMPVSSQLLYFHLNMEADDDGFVANPKRIMRMLNVGEDDLKILLAKRFLLAFENGVVVIKHWLLHNAVRKDMYKETQYLDEKKALRIKDNGVYTEVRNESVTDSLHRLDKVRIGKVRKDKIPALQDNAGISEVINLFKEVNPSYERLFGMPPQRAAADRLLTKHGKEKLLSMLAFLPKSNASKYAPTITTPVQFEQKLGELIAWSQKQKEVKKAIVV